MLSPSLSLPLSLLTLLCLQTRLNMCRTHGKSGRHGLSLPSPARLHSIFSGNFPVTVSGKNDQRPRGEKQREERGREGGSGKCQGQRGVWKIDFSSKLTGLQNDKHCALLRSIQRHAKLPSRRRTGYCIFAHTLAHTGTHTYKHSNTHWHTYNTHTGTQSLNEKCYFKAKCSLVWQQHLRHI